MTTTQERTEHERPLPEPDGDFYRITDALSEEDREIVRRVRSFMEERVQPIINGYWMRDEFPFELLPEMSALEIAGLSYEGYGCPGKSTLLDGIIAMELARVDCSIATFYGVHGGLAMGSIYRCALRSRNRSGCRRFGGWRRSGRSASPSPRWALARQEV